MADNKKIKKPIIGWILIGLGMLFLIRLLGINIIGPILGQWHIGMIIVGIALLANATPDTSRTTPYVLIGLGTLFFLKSFNLFHFNIGSLILPAILIAAGYHYLRSHKNNQKAGSENSIDAVSFLSGVDNKTHSKNLAGGSITSILGGANINLTDADMAADQMEIHVFAFMGGVEIKTPLHWQVNCQVIPILGGSSNESNCLADRLNMPQKNLTIKGIAIMGGISIKN